MAPELTRAAERHRERVQSKLYACEACQPTDDGEVAWFLGDRVELADLLREMKVPEHMWDGIADRLRCPNCGREGFHRYDDVGLPSSEERLFQRHLEKALREHGVEIEAFDEYLTKYPMLGIKHGFGRKIQRLIGSGGIRRTTVSGTYYRVRRMKDGKVYGPGDLGAPRLGVPGDGRYNHAGQPALYLGRTRETALRETLDEPAGSPEMVWLQQFELDEIPEVLDLTGSWWGLGPMTDPVIVAILATGVLDRAADRATKWKPEHFIPRFVGDCAREAGYPGIEYTSTRGGYVNLVLFDPGHPAVRTSGEPAAVRSDEVMREEARPEF
ncbi:MAG TPA: RES family NAD+ phosphorylase [Longimicrobium sp.]|jgi:hypothetical protein